MNKLFTLLLGLALSISLFSCQTPTEIVNPDAGDTPSNPANEPGLPTEVGKPVGAPITKTIGPGGGSLTTPDGHLSLEVPAGALSQPTTLTVQFVEKTLASGAGLAFTVSPKNIKLNKPVSLIWHYTSTTISGSAPELVGIAYQDDKGVWYGNPNTQVDKVKQTIKARMRNFAHPMSWYEQYYMTPLQAHILPNERVNFKVFFQPGRTDQPLAPDEDLLVPLSPPLEGDEALQQLTEKELRNWKLNGQLKPNADRRNVVGSLDYLGQGGQATYIAPRVVIPKEDDPLAVSVELKLNQKGVITMVSNLTMINPESEFKVGSKTFKNPYVEVISQNPGSFFEVEMWENTPRTSQNRAGLMLLIDKSVFSGTGTYLLNEDDKDKPVDMSATDGTNNYGVSWVPKPGTTKYGPITITVTEFSGPGHPAAGRISAMLHRYIEPSKSWEHVTVSGKFRIINNYFTGG